MGQSEFRYRGRALGVGLAIVAAFPVASVAQAQGQIVQQSGPAAQFRFDIGPKPLPQGLNEIGRITGLAVVFTGKRPFSVTGQPVHGNLTPAQALATLLGGTGITYRFTNAQTVTVDSGEQSNALGATPAGAIALDTIDVQGAGQGAPVGYVPRNTTVGSKTDTPIVEIPQSVSVITPEQIRDQAPRSVEEAVRYTAGVRTESYGYDPRFDRISIRGFGGTASYQDGLKLAGNNFAPPRTEMYGLDRIDVIRGPASVLYGQNDPAGLVDRISKRPTAVPLHELDVQAGNYDRYQGAFDFGGPMDPEGEFLYRLTGVVRESGTENPHGKDNRIYIAPALTWRPDADTKLTILTSYQKDETSPFFNYAKRTAGMDLQSELAKIGAFVGQAGLFERLKNSYLGAPGFDGLRHEQYRLGYEFEHRVNDVWLIKQNLHYGQIDATYNQTPTVNFNASIPALLSGHLDLIRQAQSYNDRISDFAVDNQAQAKFDTGWLRHTVVLGVDYQNATWQNVSMTAPASSYNLLAPVEGATIGAFSIEKSQRQDSSQLGLYAQDQIKAGEHWILTLGTRYDSANSNSVNRVTGVSTSQDDHAVTGRAGLTYLADNGLAPYVSWSTSFVPSIGADFGGNAFKPTTGEQYEAGIKYQPPGWSALFTLAAFEITKQNVLTQDPDPVHVQILPGAQVQTGEIRSRGIEAEGRADLGHGWKAIAAFTYQDLEVTKDTNLAIVGQAPILTPRYLVSGWIDYTVPSGIFANLGASFGVRYVGENFADSLNQVVNPALTLYDAGIHYDRDNWRFALNVTNLFDKKYETCTSDPSSYICYLGTRRHILGRVTYRW